MPADTYAVSQLIAKAPDLLGVESYVAAGAFYGQAGPFTLVAAQSLVIGWLQAVPSPVPAPGQYAELVQNKDQPNGYPGLDGAGLIRTSEMPAGAAVTKAAVIATGVVASDLGGVAVSAPTVYKRPAYNGTSWIGAYPQAVDICAEFGVSTGNTDNSTAINLALSTLGPLGLTAFLRPAAYPIQNPILIGNGSSLAASTWTGALVGAGWADWVGGFAANLPPAPAATKLLWTGAAGAPPMVQVLGPVTGWQVTNVAIDGGATAANAPAYAFLNNSGQFGSMSDVSMQRCLGGYHSVTVPVTGVQSNVMHNAFKNLRISWVALAGTAGYGLVLDCATSAWNTCFELFETVSMQIPTSSVGQIQTGVLLRGCDSNTFRDLHYGGGVGGTDIKYWIQFNFNGPSNNWPSDNLVDKVDFGSSSANCIFSNGTPLNLTTNPNRIRNVGTENGAPSYQVSIPHLIWDIEPIAVGLATLVAGTVTVTDARITSTSYVDISNCGAGGTPGSLSVVVNNGNMVITSSSGTDTSKALYKVYLIP